MIQITQASRWYGQVIGLNDVTCSIGTGITALLGQNGAGKSTLIKLVTGQLRPTTGSISVLGQQPFANPPLFSKIGYCPETDSFYEGLTGREFIELMARMGGLDTKVIPQKTAEALESVGMSDRADTKIAGFSKGMRQRIKLAQAIVHNPDILILDEPLNGLDPVGRRHVGDLLSEFASKGKCILISSHILHEVEQLTNSIVLLHRGRLMAQGDIQEIRSLIDRHPHRIRIEADNVREIGPLLLSFPSVLSIKFDRLNESFLELETHQPDSFYTSFAVVIKEKNIRLKSFYSPDNNLEAVFNYLVKG